MKKTFLYKVLPLVAVALVVFFFATSCEKEENKITIVQEPEIEEDLYMYWCGQYGDKKEYYEKIDSIYVITVHEPNNDLLASAKMATGHLYANCGISGTGLWMMVLTKTGEIDSMLTFLRSTGEDFGYCHLLKEAEPEEGVNINRWTTRQIFVSPKQDVDLVQLMDELKVPYIKDTFTGRGDGNSHIVYLGGEKDLSLYYSNRLYETGKVNYAQPNFWRKGNIMHKRN